MSLLPAVVGLGLSLLWLGPGLRLSGCSICLALFSISIWRAESTIHSYTSLHDRARQEFGAPSRCALAGRVLTSPSKRGESLSFTAFITHGDCEGAPLPSGVVRLYGGPKVLARGDTFEGIAQVGVVRIFRNVDLSDPFPGYARRRATLSGSLLSFDPVSHGSGIRSSIDRARAHVRERIELTFSPAAVGMAKALVLGENDLTEEEDAAFKGSGLAHLLAVSGTHLVFAVVSLVRALTALLLRFPRFAESRDVARWAACFGAPLALLYADFAGGSGSAWRAAWMLAALFSVRALGGRLRAGRAVAASILVGWCVDPLAVFDLSFMLSLAATTGLLTLGRRLSRIASRIDHAGGRLFVNGVIATVSSMIPCAGLLALLSPSISLIGILANVLAGPFGEVVALPLCLVHAALSFWPAAEQGTATVASGALLVVKQLALTSHDLRFLGVALPFPTAEQFVVVSLLGLMLMHPGPAALSGFQSWLSPGHANRVLAWARSAAVLVGAALLFCFEQGAREAGRPTAKLRVTALDVGQGDASLIDLPNGELMLVDGGGFVGSPVDPGTRVVLPALRARRREQIDVMVLSHPHPDHFGGLIAVAENVRVIEFWDTGQGQREGAGPEYARLIETLERQGTRALRPRQLCNEEKKKWRGAWLDVLGPCPDVTLGSNANDNSWVFRLSYGEHAVLFTGDAESHQESELLAQRSRLSAQLLKVGHHGSRTSTAPDFLAAVSPKLATISCGMRNRFGHPHEVTLETLAHANVAYARLDETGSVTWTTDGRTIQVSTHVSTRRP